MKNFKSLKNLVLSFIGIVLILTTYSSCRFFNKDNSVFPVKETVDKEEEKIAQFLVEISNVNYKILQLSEFMQEVNASNDFKVFFKYQEKQIVLLQAEINKIAENKLVTLPILNFKKLDKVNFNKNNEQIILSQLISELNIEIASFEKINMITKDSEIVSFQAKFLPQIKSILEEASKLKVKLYK